MEDEKMKTRA